MRQQRKKEHDDGWRTKVSRNATKKVKRSLDRGREEEKRREEKRKGKRERDVREREEKRGRRMYSQLCVAHRYLLAQKRIHKIAMHAYV